MSNCDFTWTAQLHATRTDSSNSLQQCNSREYEVPLSFIGEHKPVRATVADMHPPPLPPAPSLTAKLPN